MLNCLLVKKALFTLHAFIFAQFLFTDKKTNVPHAKGLNYQTLKIACCSILFVRNYDSNGKIC